LFKGLNAHEAYLHAAAWLLSYGPPRMLPQIVL
jgi:hypothetical protein